MSTPKQSTKRQRVFFVSFGANEVEFSKSGATRILSEDLNAGQVIAGIRIENPFVTPADL
jgi:predicted nucleic acid-binding protein